MTNPSGAAWDLTALVNAADPQAAQAERHLWLVRLTEWLRHEAPTRAAATAPEATPQPLLRLRLLLNVLDNHPDTRARVQGLLAAFWRDIDAPSLFADFGFGARRSIASELVDRLHARWLPGTPETDDLAALFRLLARPADAAWLEAMDAGTLERLGVLFAGAEWRAPLIDAIGLLAAAVQAAGHAPALRLRMDRSARGGGAFAQLGEAAASLRHALHDDRSDDALQVAARMRALLQACRSAAATVPAHLERFGVSADIVFELEQLERRTDRIERLLACVLAPAPGPEWPALLAHLAATLEPAGSVRALLGRSYSLLARQVAERNAEVGEHYITRDRAEYRDMLRRAAGGGAVIAGTTFVKFAIVALGLGAFWTGFWSGANYALSFVVVMLLHWTVATKQPAMTAPALAASLPAARAADDAEIEGFVDRVAQLIRSQAAGIFGNLALCGPLVLAAQWVAVALHGAPLVGAERGEYVLHSLTLLGPTVLFAAFTGALLFASSLVAGWAENWFVFHRLDSALAWNPRLVALLGAPRAARWAAWWRSHVSGLAANVSLGFMLGLAPALLGFIGLPVEVRHVTLSTGQLGAALGALGLPLLAESAFWWCMAGIAATGVLNVGVSFWLAFKVALRSRGVRVADRARIRAAIRRRLASRPLDFVRPPPA
jgi:site-specific recombinase